MYPALRDELAKAKLVDELIEQHIHRMPATCFVTIPCTKEEAKSEKGVACRKKEMKKICTDYPSLKHPVEEEQIRQEVRKDPKNRDTVSGSMLLTSIKNAEGPGEEHK